MAYGQLVTKTLFVAGGRRMYAHGIAEDMAKVLCIARVPLNAVERALKLLEGKGIVRSTAGQWILTREGQSSTEKDVARAFDRVESVLKRHFPPRIPTSKLRPWFNDACVVFFGSNAERWVASTCRGVHLRSAIPGDLSDMLAGPIEKAGLTHDKLALEQGFRSFIGSTDTEDTEQLRSAGMAMFASRLVEANVTADPMTVGLIRNSAMLLDTNVLIAAQLEKHRLSEALGTLGKALLSLGVVPMYRRRTADEYDRAVSHMREVTLRVVARFPLKVVAEAKDPFMVTALARSCQTKEDFERFFDDVRMPPDAIGTLPITVVPDSPELDEAEREGENDEALKLRVANAWLRRRKRKKSEPAVLHDAGLISVATHMRTSSLCFILTLDMTLHEDALEHSGPQEAPLCIAVDALLQILAVDGTGSDQAAAEFGALMASILDFQFDLPPDAFAVEDLSWLMDIEERCADLPVQRVKELANKISRARLAGKRADDLSLRLEIQRCFQADRLTLDKDLENARGQVRIHREDADTERLRADRTRDGWVSERAGNIRSQARLRAWIESSAWLLVAAVAAVGLIELEHLAFPHAGRWLVIWNLISIGGPVLGALSTVLFRILPTYRRVVSAANEQAEKDIKNKEKMGT
jgi:hypothetical protein